MIRLFQTNKQKKGGDGRMGGTFFHSALSELRLPQKSPVEFRATTCVMHCLKWIERVGRK